MNGNTLRHCVAHEATADVVKIIAASATEEKTKLFGRVYARLHQALTDFESKNERERLRLPRWWN